MVRLERYYAGVLAIALLFGISACGDSTPPPADSKQETQTSKTQKQRNSKAQAKPQPTDQSLRISATPRVATVGPKSAVVFDIKIENTSANPVTDLAFTVQPAPGLISHGAGIYKSSCQGSWQNLKNGDAFSGGVLGTAETCELVWSATSKSAGKHTIKVTDLRSKNHKSAGVKSTVIADSELPWMEYGFLARSFPERNAIKSRYVFHNGSDAIVKGITVSNSLPENIRLFQDTIGLHNTCRALVTAKPGESDVELKRIALTKGDSCEIFMFVDAVGPASYEGISGVVKMNGKPIGHAHYQFEVPWEQQL